MGQANVLQHAVVEPRELLPLLAAPAPLAEGREHPIGRFAQGVERGLLARGRRAIGAGVIWRRGHFSSPKPARRFDCARRLRLVLRGPAAHAPTNETFSGDGLEFLTMPNTGHLPPL